jgi:membrane protease YdiL (CAAX protease family)
MQALLLLLAVPIAMWGGQSIVLLSMGQAIRWRISPRDVPTRVKRINRVVTYLAFIAVLAVFPLLHGSNALAYYPQFFPAGQRYIDGLIGLGLSVLYLGVLYGVWWTLGMVTFERRDPPRRLARRLAAVPMTAALAALFEELLFRAVLLDDLLDELPTWAAVALGALTFAAAHYVRSVKRYWTFPGHVVLGVLLCVAYVWTEALWLPIGLHAGGVLVLMGVRPIIQYTGPTWVVGESVYPYAGVMGIGALLAMIIHLSFVFARP